MTRFKALAHLKWECKFHIVWILKYRRKNLYGETRQIIIDGIIASITEQNQNRVLNDLSSDKHIVILDDSKILLSIWDMKVKTKQIHFLKPEDFFLAFKQDRRIIDNALCIITDYIFDNENSKYDGLSFAKKVSMETPEIPIFLSTDFNFEQENSLDTIDGIVDKDAITAWEQIQSKLNLKKSKLQR